MRRPNYEIIFNTWFQRAIDCRQPEVVHPRQCFCVTGAHGIGKTHWIKEMAEKHHYRILWITPDRCENAKQMLSFLQKYLFATIDTVFDDYPLNQYMIVMDEWESLLINDRNMFQIFQQWISKIPPSANPYRRPIVSIGHLSMEKRFRELKETTHLWMVPPNEADICLYLRSQFKTLSAGTIATIAESCEGNLRSALEMATLEKGIPNPSAAGSSAADAKPATPAKPAQTDGFQMRWMYSSVQKAPPISQLFQLKSTEEAFALVQQDPWMVPLRFHENLLKDIENRKGTKAQKIKLYNDCLTTLIQWDGLISNSLQHEDNNAFTTESISHLSATFIFTVSHHLPHLKKPKYTNAELSDFTKMLSQLSLQKKQINSFYDRYKGTHYPIHEYPHHWFAE